MRDAVDFCRLRVNTDFLIQNCADFGTLCADDLPVFIECDGCARVPIFGQYWEFDACCGWVAFHNSSRARLS